VSPSAGRPTKGSGGQSGSFSEEKTPLESSPTGPYSTSARGDPDRTEKNGTVNPLGEPHRSGTCPRRIPESGHAVSRRGFRPPTSGLVGKRRGRQLEAAVLSNVGSDKRGFLSRIPVPKRELTPQEPVHLFQSLNYKLCVSIGATANIQTPLRAVLDTGAGPNLVREDVLPKGWERLLVPDVALPRITNASGIRMSARGVIVLFVQVVGLSKRVRFYVTPGQAVPFFLGCGFINLYVKTIHPRERRVELTEGGSVAISNGPDACGAAAASVRQPTPSTKVRLARRIIVPPRCEAHVEVTTAVEGLCLLLQHSRPSTGPVTLASGVAEIRSHVPFRVRVINPSMRSQILPKRMVIGLASRQPEQIILIDEPHAGQLPDI
jgi:hypothetical protein